MADLFTDAAAGPPTDRLFLAVFPDEAAKDRLDALAHGLRAGRGLSGRPLARDRFHCTLRHLGDFAGVPQHIVDAASRAAASLVSTPAFDVTFDRLVSFGGREQKPWVLLGGEGAEGLQALHSKLQPALAKIPGVPRETRLTPHVTLLYDRTGVPEQAIDPIGWTVNEVVLVHSLLGQTRHVPLARWSLGVATTVAAKRVRPRFEASDADVRWMQKALALAAQGSTDAEEVPVGAVVVGPEGEWLADGSNLTASGNDPCAHAEMTAITSAAQALGSKRLAGCTLYVTLEPCAMCAMAMVHARIARVVYAADAPKTGAAGSVFDLLEDPRHNHAVTVNAGLLADEAGRQLTEFFKGRRGA